MASSSTNQLRQQTVFQLRDLVPGWSQALGWGGLAIVWAAMASSASGNTTWTNPGSGNWFAAGNWSAGVPDSTDEVFIPAGTALIISTEAVSSHVNLYGNGSLIVSNGGSYVTQPDAFNVVGSNPGSNSFVTVSGGGSFWSIGFVLIVGGRVFDLVNGGNGTVRVDSGGTVQSGSGGVTLAISSTSIGSATVRRARVRPGGSANSDVGESSSANTERDR